LVAFALAVVFFHHSAEKGKKSERAREGERERERRRERERERWYPCYLKSVCATTRIEKTT